MRVRNRFDVGWKFILGDIPEASESKFDDSQWRCVDLPHDFSIEGEFDVGHPAGGDGAYLPAGIAWYRKIFEGLDCDVSYLTFDGVYQKCDIWLNGKHIKRHEYGYTGFTVDLTDQSCSGSNVLAVRVDNSEQPNSRWYTGSGIYRHVWLTQTCRLYIKDDSVYVRTISISDVFAVLAVDFELSEDGQSMVEYTISDPSGAIVAEVQAAADRQAGQEIKIAKPALWSAETPNLYALKITLSEHGVPVDEMTISFGIRQIEFDCDHGFLINGRQEKLNGVCIHHDGGAVGAAVPEIIWQRRFEQLKQMGCNAIRMSHNPPAPELLDLCDRLGFYVMDEAFDEWKIIKRKSENDDTRCGYGQIFDQNSHSDLADMLRRDRNHPSIVIWSIGNEIPEQAREEGLEMARQLIEICHREDPGRLVTSACDNVHADTLQTRPEFLQLLDVAGFNYINRWRRHAETAYDTVRHQYPDMILLGTEHSSVGGVRGDYTLDPKPGRWWSFRYDSRMVRTEHLLKQTMIHDYICGDFMWTGVDYLGEARWPGKHASSGVIDTCNFPKDGYYLYQSQWSRQPVLHLFPHWNWQVEPRTVIPVICYTNCDKVELFHNGKSLGEKAYEFPMQGMTEWYGHFDLPHFATTTNDLHLRWDVPYEPGTLEAIGRTRYGDIVTRNVIRTTGKAVKIVAERDADQDDGHSRFAIVNICVKDANDQLVPTADHLITVNLEGPAQLIGFDNGNPEDKTQMQSASRRVMAGLAMAVIKITEPDQPVTITLTSDLLESDRLEISPAQTSV